MNLQNATLEVDFIYSPIINFAMQQNHVPVVRKLAMKNISENGIRNIGIEITADPEFALAWTKRIDLLPANELVDVGAVDIKSITKFLAELTERIAGNFTLIVKPKK